MLPWRQRQRDRPVGPHHRPDRVSDMPELSAVEARLWWRRGADDPNERDVAYLGLDRGARPRLIPPTHRRTHMPLPQDIRPVFQDIQDTLVRSESPWIERSPKDKLKILWIGRETGTWASLHHWKKGYAAPPHKHLAGAHVYILSGKLQVRTGTLNAGDYVYEPSGVLHDETKAVEDTTYLFISNGPVLFFDENGFTRYTNWEVMEKLRASAAAPQAQAAE